VIKLLNESKENVGWQVRLEKIKDPSMRHTHTHTHTHARARAHNRTLGK